MGEGEEAAWLGTSGGPSRAGPQIYNTVCYKTQNLTAGAAEFMCVSVGGDRVQIIVVLTLWDFLREKLFGWIRELWTSWGFPELSMQGARRSPQTNSLTFRKFTIYGVGAGCVQVHLE